jgi:hypothetical protein
MSIEETLTQGVQREDNHDQSLTLGILSLALGLTAVMGGGTLSNAFQFWAIDLNRDAMDGGKVLQAMSALPPVLLGIVAVVLGLVAARSSHGAASATGKAGAVTGVLAVVGGAMLAMAILSIDYY